MPAPPGAESLHLQRASLPLVPSYLEFLAEIASHGEPVFPAQPKPGEPAESFVTRLLQAEEPRDPAQIPQTTYWATAGTTVAGHIGLRHRLNAEFAELGGHIGYTVRPSYRGHGFAKEMLRQVLRTPRAQEIGKVLLTCAPDNVASNRTIRANGGVLERTIFVERVRRETNLYWITVAG
jgi:predicted acetyltransferase